MKKMEIFENNMCCDSGFCGTGSDDELQRVSDVIASLKTFDIKVRRYQPATDLQAFTNQGEVNCFINKKGMGGCPIILVDGKIKATGHYPTNEEFAEWLDVPREYTQVSVERTVADKIVDGVKGCGCFDGSCR